MVFCGIFDIFSSVHWCLFGGELVGSCTCDFARVEMVSYVLRIVYGVAAAI